MSSRASLSEDTRIIKKTLPRPTLLRDYLLDDMSSCSSNGFRSYPRRQCFTTAVRFLVETDPNKYSKQPRSNLKPKQSSMLQKATAGMIKAFKHLPFIGFWKKSDHPHNHELKRLTSLADLLKKEITLFSPTPTLSHVSKTTVTDTVTVEMTSSASNSDSWSGSDFTATTESFSTGNNSEVYLAQKDVVDELLKNNKTTKGKGVGTTTVTVTETNYSDSSENAKKWHDKDGEQSSPVSVMDYPNEDDNDDYNEDEVYTMSRRKHQDDKGTKISKHKTRVFERVSQLEPVKLEDRLAQSVIESSTIKYFNETQEEVQIDKKAMALLQLMKSTVSTLHLLKYEVVESVLLEFFKESSLGENVSEYEMLQRAKSWIDGREQEMFVDWECENNRKVYLRDMEKGVKWSNYDHQFEKLNIGLEVECEIFSSLVNDVLTELSLQEV